MHHLRKTKQRDSDFAAVMDALPTPDDPDVITLYGERGGIYLPVKFFSVAALREQGFSGQFMLSFTGQIDQLSSPNPSSPDITPQVVTPVQPAYSITGGKPCRTARTLVEKVTFFFATGQSKILSGI